MKMEESNKKAFHFLGGLFERILPVMSINCLSSGKISKRLDKKS